jgi:hypothetical protein
MARASGQFPFPAAEGGIGATSYAAQSTGRRTPQPRRERPTVLLSALTHVQHLSAVALASSLSVFQLFSSSLKTSTTIRSGAEQVPAL